MYEFKVQGMTCPSCARSMKKAIASVDPSVELEVNLPAQTVKVRSQRPASEIADLIEQSGFAVIETRTT